MLFYALRITCQSCGASFLVGGGAGNDLTRWRKLIVECRRCSAEVSAAAGQPVDLRALPSELGTNDARRMAPRA
jgi:hypothetical protein